MVWDGLHRDQVLTVKSKQFKFFTLRSLDLLWITYRANKMIRNKIRFGINYPICKLQIQLEIKLKVTNFITWLLFLD